MNNIKLQKYAKLLIKKGINIQEGQVLVVRTPVEMFQFVRLIAEEAYKAGAKNVVVDYTDAQVSLSKFKLAPLEYFGETLQWKADGFAQMAREGAGFLSLVGTNPDLYKDVDAEKISLSQKTNSTANKEFMNLIMSNTAPWCVAAVPEPAWAKKVYPDLSEEEAVEKLWESIFVMTRVDREDPVLEWDNHIANIKDKCKKLNDYNFKTLHYTAEGTDLKVDLAINHIWIGAEEKDSRGTTFIANMPTEEIFTMPKRDGVNGYVSNTKPFNYSGNLIDGFKFTFENGKIIKAEAKVGEEVLNDLLDTDDGGRYLGEVALVPHDSPISNTNTIFYETLFDENASCHLAFGAAYPTNIKDGNSMTSEELLKNGANVSLIHYDFMIGSEKLNIDGITFDGKVIPIFRDGNWVI